MIVAGLGFSTSATVVSLRDAFAKAAAGHQVTHLATPQDKVASAVFADFAGRTELPVIGVSTVEMADQETSTLSPRSLAERGTGSVAEACALAACAGRLLAPRSVSDDRTATCAIAIGEPE